jgi:hypothetical protein
MTLGSPYPRLLVNTFRGCLNAQKKFKIFPFWQIHVTKELLPSKRKVTSCPIISRHFFISFERQTGIGNKVPEDQDLPAHSKKQPPRPKKRFVRRLTQNLKTTRKSHNSRYYEFRHRMQRYAATRLVAGERSNLIRAEGVPGRLELGQNPVFGSIVQRRLA